MTPGEVGRGQQAGRWAVTGYALLLVLAFPLLLVLVVLLIASGVLVIVWVGIPLLMLLIPVARGAADAQRRGVAHILGEPVPSSYLPDLKGPLSWLQVRVTDPMTWRDLLWLLWSVTFGFVISLLVLVLFVAVVTIPIWWYAAVPIMRAHATVDRALLSYRRTEQLEARIRRLAESRAGVVDHSAAELRRVERDLHDGPQARLAALALSLGMADDLLDKDPEGARRLVRDARESSSTALGEIRDVVRGIHPPVLADRGLVGAVEALALDMAAPVEVTHELPGRAPPPVESAVYFAVAECLANIGKHAHASRAWVRLRHDGAALVAVVGDDGVGGADPAGGSGLRGVGVRLGALDGTLGLSSPPGGPTTVTLEVPCALSSPKTTPSSGPA